ncbi:Calsyntenin-1 [Nymphon striatum]|nr:Calsyntenin-1 [Nymphon striatum]
MDFYVYWDLESYLEKCALASSLRLDLQNKNNGYHGLVSENSMYVKVDPQIRAVGGKCMLLNVYPHHVLAHTLSQLIHTNALQIETYYLGNFHLREVCSFAIVNKHHGEAPFEFKVIDKEGNAELKARHPNDLNCEKRRNYKFDIAAVGCDGRFSDNATVHVTVLDENEYRPVFLQESYVSQVDEGRLYDKILQVEAEDEDCSPKYGDICKYEIITPNQPFVIDINGNIKNTEPLDWKSSHNHILEIVAYDCAMNRSNHVMVNIKVNRVCRLGWKGIQDRIEYTPNSGSRLLFPKANLQLCEVPCAVDKVTIKISLQTKHIAKGCDRDTYSVENQRKMCGASQNSVDLLPTPGLGSEWTSELMTDDGHESDQIYEFDGETNAVVIPDGTLDHNLTTVFTISTWMKHKSNSAPKSAHKKEHIICNADDHAKNRHHYSLFVRNCRLVLLIRRDFTQQNLNTFMPAEWRWKLAEVCDNDWHHYAVNVNFPNVTLYVDGRKFRGGKINPEVIDDWPLHPTHNMNTTLAVGACWHGGEQKMKHHFRGYLAGLSILRKSTESAEVLACLHKCKEGLELTGLDRMQPGTQVQSNTDQNMIRIESDDVANTEELVSEVAYINSREYPTPGRRGLNISTLVMCTTGKVVKMPPVQSYVMVLQPEQPVITITGTQTQAKEYEEFQNGASLFSTINIYMADTEEELSESYESEEDETGHNLDSCTVAVYPALKPDWEYFTVPEHALQQYGISFKLNSDGIVLQGAADMSKYEQVLKGIQYYNRKPAYYLNRTFKLVCSELNNRFVSKEYIQTLTVIHPQIKKLTDEKSVQDESDRIVQQAIDSTKTMPKVANSFQSNHDVNFKEGTLRRNNYLVNNMIERETFIPATPGHAVIIIIVVCVGFLIFMIVLGVIRIRAAHQRAQESRDDDQEMAWDDSSLTITVNPMEQNYPDGKPRQPPREYDSETDDDGTSSLP